LNGDAAIIVGHVDKGVLAIYYIHHVTYTLHRFIHSEREGTYHRSDCRSGTRSIGQLPR
jgi:hypothetical protein